MKNIVLVIQREFLTRVRKKSFIILSLLTPVIFALTMFIYIKLIFGTSGVEVSDVKVADNTQWVGENIANSSLFKFEIVEPASLETLRERYADSESIVLYIDGEKDGYPITYSMYSKKSVSIDLQEYVRRAITSTVENRKLKDYDIDNLDEILASIRTPVNMQTIKWDKNKEDKKTNTQMIMAVSYIFAFILYMFIVMFGAMVMRGVIEEKSNRIIEIIISSVKPFQLMAGKIIGVALVAILQFFIWIVLTGVFLLAFQSFSSNAEEANGAVSVVGELAGELAGVNIVEILVCFILFFIGGYLLYASMFAAVGSAVESEADSQQLMFPITIPLMLAIMIMVQTFRYPDSSLSVWASMIPFTSPIIMVARIPFGVPLWQILLSLTILIVTFIFMSYLTAKIYRVGILMYGKKPSFKELYKWMKYK